MARPENTLLAKSLAKAEWVQFTKELMSRDERLH